MPPPFIQPDTLSGFFGSRGIRPVQTPPVLLFSFVSIDFDRMCRDNPPPAVLMLAGPTGIGKTELAIELAERFPVEIISADSMQVYRGMEIGAAQPTSADRKRARFHLCGIAEPTERFNAKRFLELCDAAHADIVARGRVPLYVGGTGMYLRALRWGLFESAGPDPEVLGEWLVARCGEHALN